MSDSITYAEKIIQLAIETITVRYRFFDNALAKYKFEPVENLGDYRTDGEYIYYDPDRLIKDYINEQNFAVRLVLHLLFHGIFMHIFTIPKEIGLHKTEADYDLAADIVAESIVLELNVPDAELRRDAAEREVLNAIRKMLSGKAVTLQRVLKLLPYDDFKNLFSHKEIDRELFQIDNHRMWHGTDNANDEIIISEEDWKRISEKVRTEISDFMKDADNEELIENLAQALKERHNYIDILKRFAVPGEEIKSSPDEFDYIYYSYGLSGAVKVQNCDEMRRFPLIEPLEYTEVKKIRQFAIVIDTSASCSGSLVRSFLKKSFEILGDGQAFASTFNIHIICCDAMVRSDEKITDKESMIRLTESFSLKGYGATDYRPAFEYVDKLISDGEFDDLKGLIYFTDGYGIYPANCPAYDAIFAYAGDDANRPQAPTWALETVYYDDTESSEAHIEH